MENGFQPSLKHAELREELKVSFAKGISKEFKYYFKARTILQAAEPEELAKSLKI